MKGEYVEQQQPKHENIGSNMFSKLQPHPQPQHQHQHLPFSPHTFQLSQKDSEDDHDAPPASQTPAPTTSTKPSPNEPTSDGATIEVVRRPRGRPPGSKNKPKPPVIITREPTEPAMSPYILEVPGGSDVVEAISRFCRRKNIGICVLTGSGTVSNVTLRQPSSTPVGSTITFHGRFDILSISATFLPPMPSSSSSFHVPNNFTISLAGPQGQIVGGIVAGSLVAAGTVFVIAATFNNPSYHRLPGEMEEGRNNSVSGSEGQSPGVSVSGSRGESGGEQVGGGMYGCHLGGGGSDVIWAPTARPPPPPY